MVGPAIELRLSTWQQLATEVKQLGPPAMMPLPVGLALLLVLLLMPPG